MNQNFSGGHISTGGGHIGSNNSIIIYLSQEAPNRFELSTELLPLIEATIKNALSQDSSRTAGHPYTGDEVAPGRLGDFARVVADSSNDEKRTALQQIPALQRRLSIRDNSLNPISRGLDDPEIPNQISLDGPPPPRSTVPSTPSRPQLSCPSNLLPSHVVNNNQHHSYSQTDFQSRSHADQPRLSSLPERTIYSQGATLANTPHEVARERSYLEGKVSAPNSRNPSRLGLPYARSTELVPHILARGSEMQRALAELVSLTHSNDFEKRAALRSDVITALLPLIDSKNVKFVANATQALANVTVLAEAQSNLLPSKVVPALVRLLQFSSDHRVLVYAREALKNICINCSGTGAKELAKIVVPLLIPLLSRQSTHVQQRNAISALENITTTNTTTSTTTSTTTNPFADVAQEHSVVSIITPLLKYEDPELQASAALLLSNVCSTSNAARDDALKLKVVPTLVHHIASATASGNVKLAAVRALANLNISTRALKTTLEEGAIPHLVTFLNSIIGNVDASTYACAALRNICWKDDRARAAALCAKAIPPLVYLSYFAEVKVQEVATSALSKICLHVPAAERVIPLLDFHDHDTEAPAKLLSHICSESAGARNAAIRFKTIPALVQLIESSSHIEVQTWATRALANINMEPSARQVSVEANAFQALVRLLQSDNDDVVGYACKAVEYICWTGIKPPVAVNELLKGLSSRSSIQVREKAASARQRIR